MERNCEEEVVDDDGETALSGGDVGPESSLSYPIMATASFPWILRCFRSEDGWV